jgi:hypothetical protein
MAGILKCDQVQSDSNLSFQVAGANVAYMNSTGLQMTGGQIIAGSNTLLTASGLIYANAGIKFPATQNASADANTLDDYEEGTWDPVDASGAGIAFPQSTACFYRKIGNLVFVSMYITVSTNSSGTTSYFGGLPFTCVNGYFYMVGRCGLPTSGTVRMQIDALTTNMRPYNAESTLTNTQMSGAYMIMAGCYITS